MLLSALWSSLSEYGYHLLFILLTSERPGCTCLQPRYGVAKLVWNWAHWTPKPLFSVVPPMGMPSLLTCAGSPTSGTGPSSLSDGPARPARTRLPGGIHIQLGLEVSCGAVATGDSGHQGTGLPRPVILSPLSLATAMWCQGCWPEVSRPEVLSWAFHSLVL